MNSGTEIFICQVCGVSGTDQSVILKGHCHKRHTVHRYSENTKASLKEKLKRKSSFPNRIRVRNWNRKYGK